MGLSAPNLFRVHEKCLEASEVCWSKLFAFCWFMTLFGVLWLFYICSIPLFSTSAKRMLHDFGRSLLPSTFKFFWLFMDLVSSGTPSKDPITFANVKKHQDQHTQFISPVILQHSLLSSFFSCLLKSWGQTFLVCFCFMFRCLTCLLWTLLWIFPFAPSHSVLVKPVYQSSSVSSPLHVPLKNTK